MKICKVCGTPSSEDTLFCYVCGAKFQMNTLTVNRGYVSEEFITDADNNGATLINPVILITDKDIQDIMDILPLLEETLKNERQILIIANSYSEEVIQTLVMNKQRGTLVSVPIKAPGFGDRRKEMLKDIALLTGGKVVSSDNGLELSNATISLCGQAKMAKITKDDAVIIGGQGDELAIHNRMQDLKEQIPIITSDYDKEKLRERLITLFGCT